MHAAASLYRRHRFPAEIISHTVWLYFRFALSFRDAEEIMRVRGVTLTYETIREWCLKFGQTFANGLCCENYFEARKFVECHSLCSDPEEASDKLRLTCRVTSI